MVVFGFLQIVGFLCFAIVTFLAGFAIYTFNTGGRDIDDVVFRLVEWLGVSPDVLVFGVIAIAWVVAVLPGVLLMANGINGEAQLQEVEEAKKAKKQSEDLLRLVEKLTQETLTTNSLLSEIRNENREGRKGLIQSFTAGRR